MIQENSPFVKVDLDTKRRQTLTKVYALLISLAEQEEKKALTPETIDTQKVSCQPNLEDPIETTE
jgi:hypothetical protein